MWRIVVRCIVKIWSWYGFSCDSWCGSKLWFEANLSKIASKPYQNRIKIVSKPYQNHIKTTKTIEKNRPLGCFRFLFLKPTHWNRIKIVSKPYQNHIKNRIKILSKPFQNDIKTTKTIQKSILWAVSASFFWSQLTGTISKSYQNHSRIISKPQKGCPGAVSVSWSQPVGNPEKGAPFPKPYQNHIQNIPEPYLNQNPNHIKNISKPYRNHNPKFKAYQIHILQSHRKLY